MTVKSPNILIVMADQMAPAFLPIGHPLTRAPSMEALAKSGVVFDSAYCNSPLCSPSRASFMSGLLPSRSRVYDNAAEFGADVPTFAHCLRLRGYRTILSGKMHFCGPDQLHGFEERLTTDIYPADFNWTPDWDRPEDRPSWYHNMSSVQQAGVCVRSNQLDFDERGVHGRARDLRFARSRDRRPFLLVASFSHPHDPFAVPQRYWDLFRDSDIDMPAPAMAPDALDAHSRRLRHVCAMDVEPVTEAQVRDARHAYYGAIAYIDDLLGRLMRGAALRPAKQVVDIGDCAITGMARVAHLRLRHRLDVHGANMAQAARVGIKRIGRHCQAAACRCRNHRKGPRSMRHGEGIMWMREGRHEQERPPIAGPRDIEDRALRRPASSSKSSWFERTHTPVCWTELML